MAWPGPKRAASPAFAMPHGAVAPQDGSALLAGLRRTVEGIEHAAGWPSRPIPLGVAAVDATLGGGLARGALHEIAAEREAETVAATGFALALASRTRGPVLWAAEDISLIESGVPYGPGLDDLGLAPERLVTVAAARPREVLWAVEEALGCRGIGAVICELRSARIELTTTCRLSLAAARCGGLALLLRSLPDPGASAAATRWRVAAAPSGASAATGPGPPRFALALTRNRRGHPGSWVLEWNGVEHCFDLAPAHRMPVAQTALDRPRAARA